MDRPIVFALAGAVFLLSLIMTLVSKDKPMTEEQRQRASRFLAIHGAWTTISAMLVSVVSICAGVVAAVLGDWKYAAIFAGGAAVMLLVGLLQRRWHQREIDKLTTEGETRDPEVGLG